MLKKNAQPIANILSEFFNENPELKTSVAEHRAVSAWRELLGEGVSHYTKNVYFRRNVLHVQLSSSVLRAELIMNKQNLIDKLNEHAGMEIVQDIAFR
jgi:predicted nucleic acid-binding Zn ribbon protein